MGIKFYKENVVKRARDLKKKGATAMQIAKILNVGDTTILRWCNDIPSNNYYHIYAKKLRNKARKKNIKLGETIKITEAKAKILTSILYWCEGSKYPSNNFIAFSNSDVNLVVVFLKLFRLGFHPKTNKLRASLQLHSNHDKNKITSFWSKTLKIPRSQFYKPTITKPTKNMKRTDYKGTCTIRYHDLYVLLEIMGIYEGFAKKIKMIKMGK